MLTDVKVDHACLISCLCLFKSYYDYVAILVEL